MSEEALVAHASRACEGSAPCQGALFAHKIRTCEGSSPSGSPLRPQNQKNLPTRRDAMTMDPDTLLLTICGPRTGRVPVLDSPCVVEVFHSHAVGLRGACRA